MPHTAEVHPIANNEDSGIAKAIQEAEQRNAARTDRIRSQFAHTKEVAAMRQANWLEIHTEDAAAKLDHTLAVFTKFYETSDATVQVAAINAVPTRLGDLVIPRPVSATRSDGLEHTTMWVNDHKAVLLESGWWVHPAAPQETDPFVLAETFWAELETVTAALEEQTASAVKESSVEQVRHQVGAIALVAN